MKFEFIFLVSILVLSLSIVSADTLFQGEIREDNLFIGTLVENASVSVVCNGTLGTDVSNVNGVYSINFSETECNVSHAYVISAVKGNWSGNISGSVGDKILYLVAIKYTTPAPVILNTTINGTIFYSGTGLFVENASVTVTCNGNDANITLSNVNGSYSVDFSKSVCNISHVFSVFAELGEYNGTNESLNVADGTVANVVIEKAEVVTPIVTHSSGPSGGGSNTQYICEEWSECIDGFQTKACNNNSIISRSCTVEIKEELGTSEISFEDGELEDVAPTFFSTITGAVTGAVSGAQATGIAAALIFILLIVGFIIVRKKKLKK